jgi:8-oxo-dGTP pyrophosphatase MutT (NUDIX family)
MLDLDANRSVVPPRDAATLLLVRDRPPHPSVPRLEVFCVVRHVKSGFLGGAVVFPGGKVDDADRHASWTAVARGARPFVAGEDEALTRAFALAACREAIEEAAILPAACREVTHEEALALRDSLAAGNIGFRAALEQRGLSLDLGSLRPFGRWITPVAESRRFDTRFFLAAAPSRQEGAHDAHETTASFWATPAEVLARFDAGQLQVAPPTHRCLELLATVASSEEAMALAGRLSLEPICPKLVTVVGEANESVALVLPGDPEHDVRDSRVPGKSRFVLRGERWLPEGAGVSRR